MHYAQIFCGTNGKCEMKWIVWTMIYTVDTFHKDIFFLVPSFTYTAPSFHLFHHTNVHFNELSQHSSRLSPTICWKGLMDSRESFVKSSATKLKGSAGLLISIGLVLTMYWKCFSFLQCSSNILSIVLRSIPAQHLFWGLLYFIQEIISGR